MNHNAEFEKLKKEAHKQFLIEENESWCNLCETITSTDRIDDKIESFYQKYLFIDESKYFEIYPLLSKIIFIILIVLLFI